ncbi:unnamed protein product [Darwinula stevensoni]|uniref:Prenyltransferase alpha-alpha toroid domain-containing protein n=1 Tax=Darwinula stevensoni TaxID=69355 RepID=A0A7R8X1I4_9CRUS|nr:unnamed protein product [Darwinula stevensoni]CAG0882814.1 unnamed protein product [Darwinula stevensoni]
MISPASIALPYSKELAGFSAPMEGVDIFYHFIGFFASQAELDSGMRFLYCAACVCYILDDWSTVNIHTMAQYIHSSTTQVKIICLGEHEENRVACSDAREYSCGKICNRLLACTRHVCHLECHVVEGAPNSDQAGKNCESCERDCELPRPEGCQHPCKKGKCHPGECPPCRQPMRILCHCGLTQLYVRCCEWNNSADADRNAQKSCKNQCPKQELELKQEKEREETEQRERKEAELIQRKLEGARKKRKPKKSVSDDDSLQKDRWWKDTKIILSGAFLAAAFAIGLYFYIQ